MTEDDRGEEDRCREGACGEEGREETGQEAGRKGKDGPLLLQVIAGGARRLSRRPNFCDFDEKGPLGEKPERP